MTGQRRTREAHSIGGNHHGLEIARSSPNRQIPRRRPAGPDRYKTGASTRAIVVDIRTATSDWLVLVGTTIENSADDLSVLKSERLPHQVLNAKQARARSGDRGSAVLVPA